MANLPPNHLPKEEPDFVLQRRINADLDGAELPPLDLPKAPEQRQVQALMTKAGGSDAGPELRVNSAASKKGSIFFSEYYGPPLVAYAVDHPVEGESYLQEALSLHSAYNYPNYRFESLWALLRSVVQHPDLAWVKEKVQELASVALGGSSVEFNKGLPLTLLAVQAKAGDTVASEDLEKQSQQIWNDVTAGWLVAHRDTWGWHKRRLLTLAQSGARPGYAVPTPDDLLQRALE